MNISNYENTPFLMPCYCLHVHTHGKIIVWDNKFWKNMEKHKTSIVKSPRDLGFLESIDPSDSWQLESRFFPSKLGGKPSWLNLKNLPSSSQILCPSCRMPRSFLCQLYANIDDKPDCFHRTLFIFMCRSNKVWSY